jgi:hypothetical protein
MVKNNTRRKAGEEDGDEGEGEEDGDDASTEEESLSGWKLDRTDI